MACARDGDVGEAGVEKVRVDTGIGVNKNAFGGEALGAVAGDGVAVVEVPPLLLPDRVPSRVRATFWLGRPAVPAWDPE